MTAMIKTRAAAGDLTARSSSLKSSSKRPQQVADDDDEDESNRLAISIESTASNSSDAGVEIAPDTCTPRIRRLVCLRQLDSGRLGFSLRGGKEATGCSVGVFVSHVQRDSEAFRKGLMIGDRLTQVNGLHVNNASYSEVIELIKKTPKNCDIRLVVEFAGIIPVQERTGEPIKWLSIGPAKALPLLNKDHQIDGDNNNNNNNNNQQQWCDLHLIDQNCGHRETTTSGTTTKSVSSALSSSGTASSSDDDGFGSGYLDSSGKPAGSEASSVSTANLRRKELLMLSSAASSTGSDVSCASSVTTTTHSSSVQISSLGDDDEEATCDDADSTEQRICVPGGRQSREPFGCGVVKGPANWPGIFVQHVKDGSLAERVGLEPGDQLVQADEHPLDESLSFDEAITLIKTLQSQQDELLLVVRKGAALRHLSASKRQQGLEQHQQQQQQQQRQVCSGATKSGCYASTNNGGKDELVVGCNNNSNSNERADNLISENGDNNNDVDTDEGDDSQPVGRQSAIGRDTCEPLVKCDRSKSEPSGEAAAAGPAQQQVFKRNQLHQVEQQLVSIPSNIGQVKVGAEKEAGVTTCANGSNEERQQQQQQQPRRRRLVAGTNEQNNKQQQQVHYGAVVSNRSPLGTVGRLRRAADCDGDSNATPSTKMLDGDEDDQVSSRCNKSAALCFNGDDDIAAAETVGESSSSAGTGAYRQGGKDQNNNTNCNSNKIMAAAMVARRRQQQQQVVQIPMATKISVRDSSTRDAFNGREKQQTEMVSSLATNCDSGERITIINGCGGYDGESVESRDSERRSGEDSDETAQKKEEEGNKIRIVRQNCKLHHPSMHSFVKTSLLVSERFAQQRTPLPPGARPAHLRDHTADKQQPRQQVPSMPQRYVSMDNLLMVESPQPTSRKALQQQQQQQQWASTAAKLGMLAAPRTRLLCQLDPHQHRQYSDTVSFAGTDERCYAAGCLQADCLPAQVAPGCMRPRSVMSQFKGQMDSCCSGAFDATTPYAIGQFDPSVMPSLMCSRLEKTTSRQQHHLCSPASLYNYPLSACCDNMTSKRAAGLSRTMIASPRLTRSSKVADTRSQLARQFKARSEDRLNLMNINLKYVTNHINGISNRMLYSQQQHKRSLFSSTTMAPATKIINRSDQSTSNSCQTCCTCSRATAMATKKVAKPIYNYATATGLISTKAAAAASLISSPTAPCHRQQHCTAAATIATSTTMASAAANGSHCNSVAISAKRQEATEPLNGCCLGAIVAAQRRPTKISTTLSVCACVGGEHLQDLSQIVETGDTCARQPMAYCRSAAPSRSRSRQDIDMMDNQSINNTLSISPEQQTMVNRCCRLAVPSGASFEATTTTSSQSFCCSCNGGASTDSSGYQSAGAALVVRPAAGSRSKSRPLGLRAPPVPARTVVSGGRERTSSQLSTFVSSSQVSSHKQQQQQQQQQQRMKLLSKSSIDLKGAAADALSSGASQCSSPESYSPVAVAKAAAAAAAGALLGGSPLASSAMSSSSSSTTTSPTVMPMSSPPSSDRSKQPKLIRQLKSKPSCASSNSKMQPPQPPPLPCPNAMFSDLTSSSSLTSSLDRSSVADDNGNSHPHPHQGHPGAPVGAGQTAGNGNLCFVDELKMLARRTDPSNNNNSTNNAIDSATLIKVINANKAAASTCNCASSGGQSRGAPQRMQRSGPEVAAPNAVGCKARNCRMANNVRGGNNRTTSVPGIRCISSKPTSATKSERLRDEEDGKRRQHEMLMKEFKSAHSRMFASKLARETDQQQQQRQQQADGLDENNSDHADG